MASFTETATLRVDDQASGPINKINAELKKLFRTANSLQGKKSLGLDVNVAKLTAAEASLKRINAELRGLKTSAINIRVNAAGLQQATRQVQQLRSQAARPLTFRTAAAGLAGYGVGTKLAQGAKTGIKQADLGAINLDYLQMSKERRAYANEQAKEVERRMRALAGPFQFNAAMIEQRMAENLREAREGEAGGVNVKTGKNQLLVPKDYRMEEDFVSKTPAQLRQASAAEAQYESQKRMRVAQERTYQEMLTADQIAKSTGVSAEQSLEKIKGFYKALDMAGQLSDESGQNSVKRIQEAGDFIRTLRSSIGEEATGQFLQSLVRREKAGKYALSHEGQLAVAFVAEDMGPSAAGTAFSTWQNQVQGARITRAAREAQVKAGLATNARFEGKGKGKRFVADTVDAELAATNPLEYARKRMLPALKKMGMTEAQIFSNREEDQAKLQNNMKKLYSETNAANFSIALMTHLLELESKTRDAATRSADPAVLAEASKYSVQAASNAMASSFQGLAGQATVAFAPAITAVADTLSTGLASVARDIKDAADPTKTAAERVQAGGAAAAKIGYAAAAAAPAMLATKLLYDTLQKTGMGEAIGKGSAFMALTSQNEGIRGLGGAGMALMEAADALKSAASVLAQSQGMDLPGGIPGGGEGGKKGTPGLWSKVKDAAKNIWKKSLPWAGRLARGARGIGGGALMAGGLAIGALTTDPEEAKQAREILENAEKLRQAKRDLKNLEIESKILEDQKNKSPATKKRLAQIEREKKAKQYEIELRQKQKAYDDKVVGGMTAADEAAQKEKEAEAARQKAKAEEEAAAARTKAAEAAKKEEEAKPEPGTPAALAASAGDRAKEGTPLGAESASETAASITAAAASLSATSSLFAQAFSTGAQQLTAAGQTAASIISAGAAAAGSAYGEAAAAQIRAATANVTINVNNSGGGGGGTDTGALNRPK